MLLCKVSCLEEKNNLSLIEMKCIIFLKKNGITSAEYDFEVFVFL